ncbi:hypothetical protein DRQ11_10485, partial [candidate division KSB1 bacterium]
WRHSLRYLHKCRFGDGLLVRLYPYRTLTDKKLQALLGALITASYLLSIKSSVFANKLHGKISFLEIVLAGILMFLFTLLVFHSTS